MNTDRVLINTSSNRKDQPNSGFRLVGGLALVCKVGTLCRPTSQMMRTAADWRWWIAGLEATAPLFACDQHHSGDFSQLATEVALDRRQRRGDLRNEAKKSFVINMSTHGDSDPCPL